MNKSISLTNLIGFKGPCHLYRDIFDGNIELGKVEVDQEQFKSDLNEIKRGNPRKKIRKSNKNNRKYKNSL